MLTVVFLVVATITHFASPQAINPCIGKIQKTYNLNTECPDLTIRLFCLKNGLFWLTMNQVGRFFFSLIIKSLNSALRLPLCKIKSEFAQDHGIQQEVKIPEEIPEDIPAGITREGGTTIVTAESVPNEDQPVNSIRSSLIDRLRNRNNNNGFSEQPEEDTSSGNPDACRGKNTYG